MKDVLLIGEAPGRGPGEVLAGRCGARLATLAGMTMADYLAAFERINLLGRWPGASGAKGAAFPLALARACAAALAVQIEKYAPAYVVLVGGRVAAAFRYRSVLLCWRSRTDWGFPSSQRWAIIPHPSGVNRWWNDSANVERASAFLRDLAQRGREVGRTGPVFAP